jgi:hypothetical protein
MPGKQLDRFLRHPFSSLSTGHPAARDTDSAVKRATNRTWGSVLVLQHIKWIKEVPGMGITGI